MAQRHKTALRKEELDENFFAYFHGHVVCLICDFIPPIPYKYTIIRHYQSLHSHEYSHYVGQVQEELIEGLKLGCSQSRFESTGSGAENLETAPKSLSVKATAASYDLSLLIAKNHKPFTEGNLIKQCIIEAVKSFDNNLTLAQAESIQLSRNTVARRISNINEALEDKLKTLLSTCEFFSLCLDESTDIKHISNLSIFVRIVQSDFSCIEELLNFVPLHGTTTGSDIFLGVENSLKKFNLDFSKCTAIATDRAKSMVGKGVGLHGQMIQRGIQVPMIHCIIHQEALCGKDVRLSVAMKTVTKVINNIKGGHKFLAHRKLRAFLAEQDAVFNDIPLYTEVRWLSAAKCLKIFFTIRKDILLFIKENPTVKSSEHVTLLEDIEFLTELAFITDLTDHLSILNLKLQKPGQSLPQLVKTVNSFRTKLKLFQEDSSAGSFHYFPSCQILLEECPDQCNFHPHFHLLNSIIEQFNNRFQCFEALRNELLLFEDPMTVRIVDQKYELQDELCNLQNDLSLQPKKEKGVEFFKLLDDSEYPRLKKFARRIFSMFGLT